MQFLRKAALASAASLLGITLFSFGLVWSTFQVLHEPHYIKDALKTSGVYTSAVSEFLKEQDKKQVQSGQGDASDIPTSDPQVRAIITQSFPPQLLQQQVEGILDGTYGWASGKTGNLQFSIDLSSAKQNLADGLQQYALQRLDSLPACAANEIPSGDVDAFNATCVPNGVDHAAIAAKVHDQILGGDFLKDSKIDASTFKNKDGKTLSEQWKAAPKAYQGARLGVYAGAATIALLVLAVVFLSATRRGGLRKVAVTAISDGVATMLLVWLSSFAVHNFVHNVANAKGNETPLQPQLLKIVEALANDLRNWWMAYGAALVVIGIVTLLSLHLTKPRNVVDRAQAQPHKAGEGDAPDLPVGDAPIRSSRVRHEHVVDPPKHDGPVDTSAPS
jgi:high-affinity Fe2+/Pb2+ permease